MLAGEPSSRDLFSLSLLLGLPFAEISIDDKPTRRRTSRVDDVTARAWFASFEPGEPAAPIGLLVGDLIHHGLRESCREFVTEWMNGDIDLVDRTEEGGSQ